MPSTLTDDTDAKRTPPIKRTVPSDRGRLEIALSNQRCLEQIPGIRALAEICCSGKMYLMTKPSLLAQAVLEPLLTIARRNLERDGYLVPVLFVQLSVAGLRLGSLQLPQTSEQKRRYLAGLGAAFRERGQIIRAAVMLSESWFVDAQTTPAALAMPPSTHPGRQEAITLVGRDAQNTRATHVVLPFTRDARNRPVWGKRLIAAYDEPAQTGSKFDDLLHYLFLANRRDEYASHS